MAAELARHLGVPGPLSRILLKQHDREEWDQLALHAAEVCPSLADMLEKKVTQLQGTTHPGVFVPACSRKSWREILCRTVLVLRSVFFFFSGGARPDWLSILCIHSYQVSCNRVKSYSGLALDC